MGERVVRFMFVWGTEGCVKFQEVETLFQLLGGKEKEEAEEEEEENEGLF